MLQLESIRLTINEEDIHREMTITTQSQGDPVSLLACDWISQREAANSLNGWAAL